MLYFTLFITRTFLEMFNDIPGNVWRHSKECFGTLPGIFGDIPRNVWRHSPECLRAFPGMFEDIPRNVRRHSPDCLRTFLGMFEDISRNVWRHSPVCLGTFRHSPEYNILSIPRVPCIPFPVPVFLILYIANRNTLPCFYRPEVFCKQRCS